jgi:hypothetical protein
MGAAGRNLPSEGGDVAQRRAVSDRREEEVTVTGVSARATPKRFRVFDPA